MHRLLKLAPLIVGALSVVPVARGDIFFVIDQKSVRVAGLLTGSGNGSGMPIFLVPVAIAPRPFACGPKAVCSPQIRSRPGPRNYARLGSFRTKPGPQADQCFRFRVPHVKRGAYKVVVWCRACGGSLILAGGTIEGQTVLVR
ncbi:MAG: hypothetical protein ACJ757_17725 [Gaiellaceae bacterium]